MSFCFRMTWLMSALQSRCAFYGASFCRIGFRFHASLFQMMGSLVFCSNTTHMFSFPISCLALSRGGFSHLYINPPNLVTITTCSGPWSSNPSGQAFGFPLLILAVVMQCNDDIAASVPPDSTVRIVFTFQQGKCPVFTSNHIIEGKHLRTLNIYHCSPIMV